MAKQRNRSFCTMVSVKTCCSMNEAQSTNSGNCVHLIVVISLTVRIAPTYRCTYFGKWKFQMDTKDISLSSPPKKIHVIFNSDNTSYNRFTSYLFFTWIFSKTMKPFIKFDEWHVKPYVFNERHGFWVPVGCASDKPIADETVLVKHLKYLKIIWSEQFDKLGGCSQLEMFNRVYVRKYRNAST